MGKRLIIVVRELTRHNKTVLDSASISWGKPMILSNVRHILSNRLLLMVTTLFFTCILAACESAKDSSGSTSTRDTGSISFNVVWNQRSDIDTDYQTRAVICGSDPDEVDTVLAVITKQDVSVVRRGGPWDCTAPSGTIQNVPVGSDYIISFYGHNEDGRATYSGAVMGITVETGDNNIGTIEAGRFYSQMNSPADTSSDIDPDSATFSWAYAFGASRYQLQISESPDLSDAMTFETENLSYVVGGLDANTTYYWTVYSIDIDGKISWFRWDIYSFTTASTSTGDDNYEENDTRGTAYDLSDWDGLNLLDLDGYGSVTYVDPDYYQITVPYEEATIEISCTFTNQLGDIDIELQNEAGMVLLKSDSQNDNEFISYSHSSGPSTIYYVKVYRYDEDPASNQYDLTWYIRPAAPTDVNLTAYNYDWGNPDLDIFFRLSNYNPNWGDSLDVRFAVINDGSENIPSGTGIWVRLYLSADNVITELDYELEYRVFGYGLESGWYIYQQSGFEWPISLPSEPPPGFSASGQFYIGMVIDPDNLVIETDEYDNANMGEEWDYAPVFISP